MIRFPSSLPFIAVLLAWTATSGASAQDSSAFAAPRILFYQGVLTDMTGAVVPDGSYGVTMRLYAMPEGGRPLWEERQMVSVYGGMFELYLGVKDSLALPFDRTYWLGAQMEGEPEMTPRTLLVSAPYAIRAAVADQAARLAPGAAGAVTGLNGAEGEITIRGEDGIRVSRSGNVIRIGKETGAAEKGSGAPTAPLKEKEVEADGTSGVIVLALGGKDLPTAPPVAGSFQSLGGIVVRNPHVTEGSIVHVSVLEKEDDGAAPNPEQALFVADADDRRAGSFRLLLGMIPTATSAANFQPGDVIRIGYTILNPPK